MTRTLVVILVLFAVSLQAEEPWIEPEQKVTLEVPGIVVDVEGKPVSEAMVVYDRGGDPVRTDTNGFFRLSLEGRPAGSLRVVSKDGDRTGYLPYIHPSNADPETGRYRIEIAPPRKVHGHVLDVNGKPVVGATVWSLISEGAVGSTAVESQEGGRFTLEHPTAWPLRRIFVHKSGFALGFVDVTESRTDWKNGPFTITLEEPAVIRLRAVDEAMQPIEGVVFSCWHWYDKNERSFCLPGCEFRRQTTDANGVAIFDWLPHWIGDAVSFFATPGKNRPDLLSQTARVAVESKPIDATVVFHPGVRVRGTVYLPDGSPAEDWAVLMKRYDGNQRETRTDRRGRYEFFCGKNIDFYLSVRKTNDDINNPKAEPVGIAPVRFDLNSGVTGLSGIDFRLEKPVRVHGTVSKNPEPGNTGRVRSLRIAEIPAGMDDSDRLRYQKVLDRYVSIREDDGFESWLPKGEFKVQPIIRSDSTLTPSAKTIKIAEEEEIRFNLEIEGAIRHRTVFVRIESPEGENFDPTETTIYFVPKPESGVREVPSPTKPQRKDFEADVPAIETKVFVSTGDHRLGCAVDLPMGQNDLTLRLERTGRFRGILYDKRGSTSSVIGHKIFARPKGFFSFLASSSQTDENGVFELDGVIPGVEYELGIPYAVRDWPGLFTWGFTTPASGTAAAGEVHDFGRILRPRMSGASAFGWAFRNLYEGGEGNQTLESAWESLRKKSETENRRLLLIFGECDSESPTQHFLFYELAPALYDDATIAPIFERFVFMGIPIDDRTKDGRNPRVSALDFARRHGIRDETASQTALCVFDSGGQLLRTLTVSEIMEFTKTRSGKPWTRLDKPRLLEFLKR